MFEEVLSSKQKNWQQALYRVKAENTPMLVEFYDACINKGEISLALCLQGELISRGETAQIVKTLNFAIAANDLESFTARRLAEGLKNSDDPTIVRVRTTLKKIAEKSQDKQ